MAPKSMPRRTNRGFLAPIEQPTLIWLAQRTPSWVSPDMMTAVGFLGACIVAIGYALVPWNSAFLWLASLGLVINWAGDSLDGNLARIRKIERPRYGFFLDQSLDAFEQMLFGIGMACSGLVRPEIALFALAAYFMMVILNLVRAVVSNEFALDYAGIGLSELRLIFVFLNTVMFFVPPHPFKVAGFSLNYAEAAGIAWGALLVVAFWMSLRHHLGHLAKEEPERS